MFNQTPEKAKFPRTRFSGFYDQPLDCVLRTKVGMNLFNFYLHISTERDLTEEIQPHILITLFFFLGWSSSFFCCRSRSLRSHWSGGSKRSRVGKICFNLYTQVSHI